MTSVQQAWRRLRELAAFRNMKESDFRPIVYCQIFNLVQSGATTPNTPANFPGGAIILGITAAGFLGEVGVADQGNNNRQSFGLAFSYTNAEALTPGGPISADALLGSGADTNFPARELLIPPNQMIQAQVKNFSNAALSVHVCYHALLYRYAT